jgi:hypothetical protein
MSLIRVQFDAEWEMPVYVRHGDFHDRAIDGPREALRFLQVEFRHRSGELYWLAIDACYSALRYRSDPEEARARFLAAYTEHELKTGI